MDIFTEITILVVTAACIALIMRWLKQPLVIGHIITGLIVGPVFLDFVHSEETLRLFSEIGISFLLFIVGLNLTPAAIRAFGRVALLTGIGQIVFTFAVGWALLRMTGYPHMTAAYLSIAFAFSSTIIILKLLSDKGDLEKLYAKIAVGFLLVQDFVAIIILFLVPLFSSSEGPAQGGTIIATLLKGMLFVCAAFAAAWYWFPRLNRFIARSQELLFLFAVAWGLGLAALFRAVGFSLESGALLAGVTLSLLPSHDEIHARMKPLRDFFLVLFFILLGAKMNPATALQYLPDALLFSAFILIGNPLIVMAIMGAMGYRKKTSFQTGLTVAQISEFSLIVVALGATYGHVPEHVLSMVTLVGLITIFVCTYMVMNSDRLYTVVAPLLWLFERKDARERHPSRRKWDTVLFGFNRIGFDFYRVLQSLPGSFLVVDYNPDVIELMRAKRLSCLYGDASDAELLQMIDMERTKLIISTIPDFATNILILTRARAANPRVLVVGVAYTIDEALALYAKGFDYVIMPHFLGGKHASLFVAKHAFHAAAFARERTAHLAYLKERQRWGHEHPHRESAGH